MVSILKKINLNNMDTAGYLETFIRSRLSTNRRGKRDTELDILASKMCRHADGNFLYASLILDELERGTMTLGDVERLVTALSTNSQTPSAIGTA